MLKQLAIRNIAIIDEVRLDLQDGLTVLTGESGSGKSILLDAMALVFGQKISPKDILRAGADRGTIELEIALPTEPPTLQALLDEQGVERDGHSLFLSREISASGSRSRINGTPVPREVMALLRPHCVDLHGQHELTDLFQNDKQRLYLDALGGADLSALKSRVRAAYESWQHDHRELESLRAQQQQRERELDFLRFQHDELEAAQITDPAEDEQRRQELETLRHAEKLIRLCGEASHLLGGSFDDSPAAADLLGKAEKRLAEAAGYASALAPLLEKLQAVTADLKHLSGELAAYAEGISMDPERIAEAGDRLDQLEKLKRKYGPTLADVMRTHAEVAESLNRLENSEQLCTELEAHCAEKEAILKTLCQQLHEERTLLARTLMEQLTEKLAELGMPSARFEVQLDTGDYGPDGSDRVTFLFSANPGEPPKPLAKVASGGELSRVLLALKVLTAASAGVPTLVFDEIDTGISGKTARVVAEQLAGLARHLQVLVITHQPMIAAMATHHWHVEKETGKSAQVLATRLQTEKDRLRILSRLVSGTDGSDKAVEDFIRQLRAQAPSLSTLPG